MVVKISVVSATFAFGQLDKVLHQKYKWEELEYLLTMRAVI